MNIYSGLYIEYCVYFRQAAELYWSRTPCFRCCLIQQH